MISHNMEQMIRIIIYFFNFVNCYGKDNDYSGSGGESQW